MKPLKISITVTAFVCLLSWQIVAIAQQRGSITGRIVSESGKPLVNIPVSLSGSGIVSRSTTTDSDGNFQFNELTDQMYFVFPVTAQGYIPEPMLIGSRVPRHRPGDTINFTMLKGGVISGLVTDTNGNPMVAIPISVIRIRDAESNKGTVQASMPMLRPRTTDDRGIYRIYGLQPGIYIVAANGNTQGMANYSPYFGQTPTYHPSAATRDTATEIEVSLGSETTGIDIRFRGELGRVISGKVTGSEALATSSAASVTLINATTNTQIGNDLVRQSAGQSVFSIQGVPEGEYLLTATRAYFETDEFFRSEPRRISVKGSDVTGVVLPMSPMALVTGRIVLEKSPTVCDAKLATTLRDVSLTAWREAKTDLSPNLYSRFFIRGGSTDEKGEFKIRDLSVGLHRLRVTSRNESWFAKSINVSRFASSRPSIVADLVRSGLTLKPGERMTGVTVTMADGAASLSGKLTAEREGDKLSQKMRVHLIPAEPAAAETLLRYYEAMTSTGPFNFTNLAPGKYRLLAKPIADNESADRLASPVAWDSAERAKLRKEAEAAKNEIELKSCQRVKDHVLKFEK